MAKGKYVTWEFSDYEFGIGWLEDGECDAHLGQSTDDGKGPAPKEREDWEWWIASKIMLEMGATRSDRRTAYVFDSRSAATAAMQRIKLEFSQERPMPDWAKKALAEGWKAPKGWKA